MFRFLKKLFSSGDGWRSEPYRLFESMTVYYAAPGSDGSAKTSLGEGLDLSVEALRFASDHRFRKKDIIELDLQFQGDNTSVRKVTVHGRVLRSGKKGGQRRYRTFCVFEEMNEAERSELNRFINWLKMTNANAHYRYGPSN